LLFSREINNGIAAMILEIYVEQIDLPDRHNWTGECGSQVAGGRRRRVR